MPEFDPASEKQFPLLIVKAVEPGCTTELQIEECRTGAVIRLTTTDFPSQDDAAFTIAVVNAFTRAWIEYNDGHRNSVISVNVSWQSGT
jgi:hypothetical protein